MCPCVKEKHRPAQGAGAAGRRSGQGGGPAEVGARQGPRRASFTLSCFHNPSTPPPSSLHWAPWAKSATPGRAYCAVAPAPLRPRPRGSLWQAGWLAAPARALLSWLPCWLAPWESALGGGRCPASQGKWPADFSLAESPTGTAEATEKPCPGRGSLDSGPSGFLSRTFPGTHRASPLTQLAPEESPEPPGLPQTPREER